MLAQSAEESKLVDALSSKELAVWAIQGLGQMPMEVVKALGPLLHEKDIYALEALGKRHYLDTHNQAANSEELRFLSEQSICMSWGYRSVSSEPTTSTTETNY